MRVMRSSMLAVAALAAAGGAVQSAVIEFTAPGQSMTVSACGLESQMRHEWSAGIMFMQSQTPFKGQFKSTSNERGRAHGKSSSRSGHDPALQSMVMYMISIVDQSTQVQIAMNLSPSRNHKSLKLHSIVIYTFSGNTSMLTMGGSSSKARGKTFVREYDAGRMRGHFARGWRHNPDWNVAFRRPLEPTGGGGQSGRPVEGAPSIVPLPPGVWAGGGMLAGMMLFGQMRRIRTRSNR